MMKTIPLVLLLAAAIAVNAKTPSSGWKQGTLKRVTKEHLTGESGQLGKKPPKHGLYISYYFVEEGNQLYEGDDVQLKQNEKGFPVSVNDPVQFLISGSDMYLRDQKGKRHRLRLVNVLPTNAGSAKPAAAQK
ncbi:MAG: hypothetical protein JOZ10_06590 [Acidobacteria bacterium]|nr:hypothetical protein [Acidobacteriota bacterium]MBV9435562.1 hypothetical protein [Acidobacteriota bacterium]